MSICPHCALIGLGCVATLPHMVAATPRKMRSTLARLALYGGLFLGLFYPLEARADRADRDLLHLGGGYAVATGAYAAFRVAGVDRVPAWYLSQGTAWALAIAKELLVDRRFSQRGAALGITGAFVGGITILTIELNN